MKSLSSVGLGLSIVFGCLFLALVAEVYYLLWWKKRIPNRNVEDGYCSSTSTGTARVFFYMFCRKNPPTHEILVHDAQAHLPFGEDSVEADLIRLQNLSGPPRFLFTIKEETKEDMESEDGKSRGDRSRKGSRGRSLSDVFHLMETPYLTPMASPPYYTPPLTPVKSSSRNMQQGFFNGFFGSASEAEFNLFLSSPPTMFTFIRDAAAAVDDDDDKQQCRRKSREVINDDVPSSSTVFKAEEQGSFMTLIVNKKIQEDDHQLEKNMIQCPLNISQVLPLASAPPPLSKP